MQRLDLDSLCAILGDQVVALPPEGGLPPATGLASHTDHLRPGDAFVALAGAHGHGLDHAARAEAAGAAFLISDRAHPRALLVRDAAVALARLGRHAREQRRGPVVGVTGSVGKTTTKTLLGAATTARTSPGNINTPAALACVLVDAWLVDPPERPLVIELGIDRRGEMATLLELVRPSHGVLTAIAEAHLEGLGDLSEVAREKSLLLHAAPAGRYVGEQAWSVLEPALRASSLRVGLGDGLPGGRFDPAEGQLQARLRCPDGGEAQATLRLPGLGAPVAQAALVALQVALDLGVAPQLAAERVAAARLEPRRLQAHALGPLTLLDDAYNASPVSMRAALDVLAALPAPRTAVLGDMRELAGRSRSAHAELGALVAAASLAGVWFVGPESRVAYEAAANLHERHHHPDVEALVRDMARLPRHGSLLVKGSRSIGLDRLVDALVAEHAQAVAS